MEKFLSKYLLLVTLLVGTASTCWADDPIYGSNLNYAMNDSTLVLTSPKLAEPATIYSQAFLNRTDIKAVVFPDNLSEIGSYAFQGCTNLQEVVIPLSVTSIGSYAFYGCSSLDSVICRSYSAPSLGTDAFTSCASGLKIYVSALATYDSWNNYTLVLCLDEYDDQSNAEYKISQFRGTKSSIDIFRTLQKAGSSFNTLCLPFNVTNIEKSPLAGAELYTFSSATVSNGVLNLYITPSSSISAGVPYLIRWPEGETIHFMHFDNISWDSDTLAASSGSSPVIFQGFYGRTQIYGTDTIAEESYTTLFLGGGNNLYYPQNNGSSMKGFRAYFKVLLTSGSPAPGMPAVLNILTSPNEATELEVTEPEIADRPRKELRNGQIVIIRNGETFLLNGQKL